jgi:hypothetical protein
MMERDNGRTKSYIDVRKGGEEEGAIMNSPALSPNLPRANIVADDQDELTKDRYHIAAIR